MAVLPGIITILKEHLFQIFLATVVLEKNERRAEC